MDNLSVAATILYKGNWQDIDRPTFATITQKGYVQVTANCTVSPQVTGFRRIDNLVDQTIQDPNDFLRPGFRIFGGVRCATR